METPVRFLGFENDIYHSGNQEDNNSQEVDQCKRTYHRNFGPGDDVGFPWFLNASTKRQLSHIFVANVALVRRIVPFCAFLARTSPEPTLFAAGKSILALTEEVENMMADWSNEFALVLEPGNFPFDINHDNRFAILSQQSFLKLTYESVSLCCLELHMIFCLHFFRYCVSTLHQVNFNYDHANSKWGARIKQSSREALWESVVQQRGR